ncbi:TetR/AcrR family transcriptional regulator [Halalkalibacterium halodurans]|uniref:Transcriptional regulator (TetR/AcrR family) n=2 Tax=Halalkalibacterium halodurans TaxID=86665 RepID=Q9KFA5_HALH5|nr:TetR/AcrR family transcriptional regulator [Halalkalibacterium halodurans]MDY7221075.1 TetR/AcrR family transcriptional regulator [Halalkalibacterium halodurans]MDY7240314.1 TetR/AcrR family transcriptional regulator [Halalkalibacterium halodurans]MED4124560.1 TetR/AcrR family transcriptional regulator [Halalkalibacterium halodurans]MED4164038.1 TetR/AcrR family transcriptional regulator [Halalkalibacterium halodurans]MED4173182.1 TetR/AcrR family transcriptional regulator [Halalkalibacteri
MKQQKLDRRVEILTVAREVLAEKGLEATKVSEIVKRAGIAQGTFYLYFESKNALIQALAEEMMGKVFAAVSQSLLESKTFEQGVKHGLRAAFCSMSEYLDIYNILINGCAVVVADQKDLRTLFDPYYELLETYIEKWQADGAVDAKLDPKITSRLIVSLTDQAVDDYYIQESATTVETYIENLTRFVVKALKA